MSWENFVSDNLKANQYSHRSEAKKDILATLKIFQDLHPEEDVYVGNDGNSKKLLSLRGTIPVNFKGTSYNIPIQILFLINHPYTAPMIFVRPTSNMVVKPSKHVDQAGRVYMPFLTDWRRPKSDTNGAIALLRQIFSQESPVYAKPQMHIPAQPQVNRYQQQGPGYPQNPQNMPMPGMPTPGGYGGGYQSYPGHHNTPHGGHQRHPVIPHGGQTPYPPTSYASQPPVSTYQPPTSQPYPTTNSYQQQSQSLPANNRLPERQGSVIAAETLHASLLSSAEDKLKRRVKEVFQMGMLEINTLESTKSELEKGNRNLTDILMKMENEKVTLNTNITMLTQKNSEAEEVLQKLESDSDNMNIDEAVVTTAPLYNQILNLFAEENAVEDAIYYLSKALGREVIDLDAYLKAVRSLSRKQFMLRATLEKARTTAGLTASAVGQ